MAHIIRYTSCGYDCFNECILKVEGRDRCGAFVEPDDNINPGIPAGTSACPLKPF